MFPRLVQRAFTVTLPAATAVVVAASAAYAEPDPGDDTKPDQLNLAGIIGNVQGLVTGLLIGLATLFLTLGCVRYMMANGDPTATEKGKGAFRNALIGYALAIVSQPALALVKSLVE
ncbi:pilin [Catellatospora sp. KI3]|uniref:pilin n=1 Tax=Catellatospora sp. KI3 TaxID=3041620 RepID=UPI002482D360|nr:pilin [Catellatospora sp. KI3]MDI1463425.1 pilin [Catellatospora sp. KI3]